MASQEPEYMQTVRKELEKKGVILLDQFTTTPGWREKVRWRCACGNECNSMFHSVKKIGHCRSCGKRKHTIEDVKKMFAEKGFQLLETSYLNNKVPLQYICRCGKEAKMSLTGLRANKVGCMECSRNNNRKDYSHYVQTFENAGCKFLMEEEDFKNKKITKDDKVPFTCFCGGEGLRSKHQFDSRPHCRACGLKARKATSLLIYGVDNPAKSDEIKEKIKGILLAKYGGHHRKLKDVQEKANETNRKNHGGVHNLALPETKVKAFYAFIMKYAETDVEAEGLLRAVGINLDGEFEMEPFENIKEYHQRYSVLNLPLMKKYMKETYGAEHALQCPELFKKQMRSRIDKKPYRFPSGRIEQVQGHEPYAIKDLLNEYDEEDIVVGCENVPTFRYKLPIENGKDEENSKPKFTKHTYYPDIYIKSENLIIEVKSLYTFEKEEKKNHRKLRAVQRAGYRAQLWIYDNNGKKIKEILYSDKFQITVVL